MKPDTIVKHPITLLPDFPSVAEKDEKKKRRIESS